MIDDGCHRRDLAATSLPIMLLQTIANEKNEQMADISPKFGSLPTALRSYKSQVCKDSHKINANFGWQPRFWDHIIRNDESYRRIKQYIIDNPKKRGVDKFNGQ